MNNNVVQETELGEILKWNLPVDITDIREKGNDIEDNNKETAILDLIFPPREWTQKIGEDEIRTYRQTVSKESSSKSDMIAMTHQLDKYLQSYQTVKKGISEIRSAIFKLFFDEILRRELVDNRELGVILFRTYNELRKIKYLWKFQSEQASDYNGFITSLDYDEHEFKNKIEYLTKVNKDLTLKYNTTKMKYYNVLDAKMYDIKCLGIAEKNHRTQKTHLRRSMKELNLGDNTLINKNSNQACLYLSQKSNHNVKRLFKLFGFLYLQLNLDLIDSQAETE